MQSDMNRDETQFLAALAALARAVEALYASDGDDD